jgi:hypothetical protein
MGPKVFTSPEIEIAVSIGFCTLLRQSAGGRAPARGTAWLAWALAAACLLLAAGSFVAGSRNHHSLATLLTSVGWNAVLGVSFSAVGALIVTQRPRNRMGWIFCAVGLSEGLVGFAYEYAVYVLATDPGAAPGGNLASWVNQWAWAPGAGLLLTFVPLLFPDGRLPSPRWRPLAWLSAVPIVLVCGLVAPLLWPLRGPALLDTGEAPPGAFPAAADLLLTVAPLLMLACGVACVAALLLRFRRALGVERLQLKWLLFATAVTVAGAIVTRPGESGQRDLLLLVATPLFAAIPVAAAIAILRHRLYDIDRLINRTLVYGLLSAVLGLAYAGMVLVVSQLFGGVTRDPPSWAVAAATLAVAALFQPARRRIQTAVDRRFSRRRYDTARTIDAFSTRLRDQVDLQTLSAELLAVVEQTMQPTRASLWLRPR